GYRWGFPFDLRGCPLHDAQTPRVAPRPRSAPPMRSRKRMLPLLVAFLFSLLVALRLAFAADQPAEGTLVVIDAAGKEQKLKAWKFVAGTRPLSWLGATPARDGDDKEPDKNDKP